MGRKEDLIKEKMIILAKEKGFESNVIGKSATAKYTKKPFYYLWLCEVHRWLREICNIDVVIVPERYSNGVNYVVQAQKWDLTCDPETNPNFVVEGTYWFNDNHEYPTYEKALEKGVKEALNLIK